MKQTNYIRLLTALIVSVTAISVVQAAPDSAPTGVTQPSDSVIDDAPYEANDEADTEDVESYPLTPSAPGCRINSDNLVCVDESVRYETRDVPKRGVDQQATYLIFELRNDGDQEVQFAPNTMASEEQRLAGNDDALPCVKNLKVPPKTDTADYGYKLIEPGDTKTVYCKTNEGYDESGRDYWGSIRTWDRMNDAKISVSTLSVSNTTTPQPRDPSDTGVAQPSDPANNTSAYGGNDDVTVVDVLGYPIMTSPGCKINMRSEPEKIGCVDESVRYETRDVPKRGVDQQATYLIFELRNDGDQEISLGQGPAENSRGLTCSYDLQVPPKTDTAIYEYKLIEPGDTKTVYCRTNASYDESGQDYRVSLQWIQDFFEDGGEAKISISTGDDANTTTPQPLAPNNTTEQNTTNPEPPETKDSESLTCDASDGGINCLDDTVEYQKRPLPGGDREHLRKYLVFELYNNASETDQLKSVELSGDGTSFSCRFTVQDTVYPQEQDLDFHPLRPDETQKVYCQVESERLDQPYQETEETYTGTITQSHDNGLIGTSQLVIHGGDSGTTVDPVDPNRTTRGNRSKPCPKPMPVECGPGLESQSVIQDDGCPTYECVKVDQADDEETCSGCSYKGRCVPIGTRVDNGTARYCGVSQAFSEQKPVGSSCQNDYECTTNTCSSGECVDLQEELEEQQSLLNRIASFLGMA